MKPTPLTTAIAALFLVACKPEAQETSAVAPAAPTEANATEVTDAIPYPLKNCLVSGEELGSMGVPPVIVYQNQQIKFCCKHCIPDFEKEPEKFIAKLKEANANQ